MIEVCKRGNVTSKFPAEGRNDTSILCCVHQYDELLTVEQRRSSLLKVTRVVKNFSVMCGTRA
jgi:hypothetical protein